MPNSWDWATEYGVKKKNLVRGEAPFSLTAAHKAMGSKTTFRERALSGIGTIASGALGSFHGRLFTGMAVGAGIGRFGSESNTETGKALDTMGGVSTGLGIAALTAPGLLSGLAKRAVVGGPRSHEFVVPDKRLANKKFLGQLESGRQIGRTTQGTLFETAVAGAEGPELVRYMKRGIDPKRKVSKNVAGRTIAGSRSHGSLIGKAVRGAAKTGLGVGKWAINNPRSAMLLGGIGLGLSALASSGHPTTNMTPEGTNNYISAIGGTSRRNDELFQGSTEGLTFGLHRSRH